MTNQWIAKKLIDLAHHLEKRKAGLYRIRAYRRAAETILSLDRSVLEIFSELGPAGLLALPGIGRRLSDTLRMLLTMGDSQARDYLTPVGQPALPYHAELSDACSDGS